MFRAIPGFTLTCAILVGIGLHAVWSQSAQPLRLSLIGHWTPRPATEEVLQIGRGANVDLRLADPLVDAQVHAELEKGWIWNRSATQRLSVDGVEIGEVPLLPGDRFLVHVPASVAVSGLRQLAAAALPKPGPNTRAVELQVQASTAWQRWQAGELLARKTFLEQSASGRGVQLDSLETYEIPTGRLIPGPLGFSIVDKAGVRTRLQNGQTLSFGSKGPAEPWQVRLDLERPKRLLQDWPLLEVRDGGRSSTYVFGDRALDLGNWGRLSPSGSKLRYRDLGQRAPVEIFREGVDRLKPGRAQVASGSVLRLGRSRYRLELGPQQIRLDLLPRGGIETLGDWKIPVLERPLSELLPSHYDVEILPPKGVLNVSTGLAGGIGEAEYQIKAASNWAKQGLFLLQKDVIDLRVRTLSEVSVWRRPAGATEPVLLRKRSTLRTIEDAEAYEQGEVLRPGDRLETAGVVLEVRRPDDRPFTALVACILAVVLGTVALIFFLLHDSRPLAIGGSVRTVYDLDPTSTRVRAIGREVVLPSIPVPNLLVPCALGLTMAGMMLQLRFWLDARLLGTSDFFLRQCGALALGLLLFLFFALRRPGGRKGLHGGHRQPGPLGIDWYIWVGMLFLILTNLLTAVGIGSRHNGFFFRIPGIGLTIQFSAFAKVFFAIGFARMFAYGLQIARGGDSLAYEPAALSWKSLLTGARAGRLDLRGVLYSGRKVVFLTALLLTIFGFYTVQNDLGPGLIFTLTLTLFVCFVMGQYNRGVRGWLRFLFPQSFLILGIVGLVVLWLLLPAHMDLGDGALQSVASPVLDKVMERLNLWWEPWRFTRGEQVVQSLWAVSGTSEALVYFSNLHSDFAFSAAVHTNGLIGGCLILAAYAVLFAAGLFSARGLFREAEATRNAVLFERSFTIVLCCLVLVVEAAIHIGACLNFSPLTGVTLPFISSGGSSILVSFVLMGVACSRMAADPPGGRA